MTSTPTVLNGRDVVRVAITPPATPTPTIAIRMTDSSLLTAVQGACRGRLAFQPGANAKPLARWLLLLIDQKWFK